jgi:hypothetical protein
VIALRAGPVEDYTRANAEFFTDIGSPGGAGRLGIIDGDHPLIAALPPRDGKG